MQINDCLSPLNCYVHYYHFPLSLFLLGGMCSWFIGFDLLVRAFVLISACIWCFGSRLPLPPFVVAHLSYQDSAMARTSGEHTGL